MADCHQCGREIEATARIGRNQECPGCGADLHVCLNCRFYDPSAAEECREPSSEPARDKDRANYCGFFEPGDNARTAAAGKEAARARMRSLFKR